MKIENFNNKIQQQISLLEEEYNNRKDSWNIPRDEALFLNMLIKIKKPKIILEIGTSYGYSTLFLAEAAHEINATVITIDINPEKTKIAKQNITNAGLLETVEFITQDANEAIKKLKENPEFIFLDGKKTDYLTQFNILQTKIKKPCLFAADNAIDLAKNMKEYLEFVRNQKNLQSVLIPIGNGLELTYVK